METKTFIVERSTVPVLIIQKFVGLCISVCLAIPAAKLYTSACNRAISHACKNNTCIIQISPELWEKIINWEFLDT